MKNKLTQETIFEVEATDEKEANEKFCIEALKMKKGNLQVNSNQQWFCFIL